MIGFAVHLIVEAPASTLFAVYLAGITTFVAHTLVVQLRYIGSGFTTYEQLNAHKEQVRRNLSSLQNVCTPGPIRLSVSVCLVCLSVCLSVCVPVCSCW